MDKKYQDCLRMRKTNDTYAQMQVVPLGQLLQEELSSLTMDRLSLCDDGYPVYGATGLIGYIQTYAQKEEYIAMIKDGSNAGRFFIVNGKSSVISTLLYLKNKNTKKYNTKYLFYQLQCINFKTKIKGLAIPHLYFSDIAGTKLEIPSKYSEQIKIATILSSIDNQIEQQQKAFDTLGQHKQALMQQLFPLRGVNTPILRLKKYSSTGSWKLISGEKLFECKTTKAGNKQLPILAITQELGAIPRNDINYNIIVSPENLANYKTVRKGDFIISLRSFQGGIEYSEYDGLCSPAYVVLRKNMDVDNTFFKYYFKTKPFVHELNKNLEGIRDGKIIRYSQFAELKIPVPPTKNEQADIAAIFDSLDKLIAANSLKLKSLLAHKKGLMQQLFPK